MTRRRRSEASAPMLDTAPWQAPADGPVPVGPATSWSRRWRLRLRSPFGDWRARVRAGAKAARDSLPAGLRHRMAGAAEIAAFGLRRVAGQLERLARLVAMPDPSRAAPHPWNERPPPPLALDRAGVARWAVENVDGTPSVWSNCAYFVSDALRLGGGLVPTEAWRPGVRRSRVRRTRWISRHPAYGCVADFVIEMQHAGRARLIGADTLLDVIPGARLGDVVVYNWDGRGHYQHLAVVTAFDEEGRMRVTQQSPSQLNRQWNRFGNGEWIPSAAWLRFETDGQD